MLVYICDFCQQAIHAGEPHFAFSVTERSITAPEGGGGMFGEVPVVEVQKTRVYTLHGQHFEEDPAALAVALYQDFNARPFVPPDPDPPLEPLDPDPDEPPPDEPPPDEPDPPLDPDPPPDAPTEPTA